MRRNEEWRIRRGKQSDTSPSPLLSGEEGKYGDDVEVVPTRF
jgi:hypothetical protein